MAKRKGKNNSTNLLKKGIALLASVVTFIFFFLEMIAVKSKYLNILKNETEVESAGVKFSEFLFSEDYEAVRETFGTATTIMWVSFILVIIAIALTALAIFAKKGAKLSKIGAFALILGMILMFVINFDKVEVLKITTWYSNMTVIYFIALALSIVGFAAVAKLKD